MRDYSGLVPYINNSKAAKSYGGPENYIRSIRTMGYAEGYADGLSERSASSYNSGLVTGCAVTGLTVMVFAAGIWLYKKYKAKKEREEYAQWNTK